MKILLVEDHPELARMTAAYLSEKGFVVDHAGSLGEGREALDLGGYDAMVLDLGLPDGDGVGLLTARPRGRPPPPTLVLTARDATADRISGLNAGADDYMVKPFELDELCARLRAVLRRPGTRAASELSLGRLTFDTVSQQVSVVGVPLNLRRRELLLLEALMLARGRIVVRDVLEERLYGRDLAVTPNAVEVTASRLRRALQDAGAEVRVEVRRGIGYLLVAEENDG
ncbi:response regulator [Phenylobacterium montanum]|uniref:Response regulator transcription factor n=1 Tax=Phenylobacterium montanum TaxID=2823693 RepID=A0A975G1V9_9CAUL|nr:response regulator transcription factor [Caulobacter sp. S6]QUD89593.1 response regulator transcription factor [Caulobacter sp. S6]